MNIPKKENHDDEKRESDLATMPSCVERKRKEQIRQTTTGSYSTRNVMKQTLEPGYVIIIDGDGKAVMRKRTMNKEVRATKCCEHSYPCSKVSSNKL